MIELYIINWKFFWWGGSSHEIFKNSTGRTSRPKNLLLSFFGFKMHIITIKTNMHLIWSFSSKSNKWNYIQVRVRGALEIFFRTPRKELLAQQLILWFSESKNHDIATYHKLEIFWCGGSSHEMWKNSTGRTSRSKNRF